MANVLKQHRVQQVIALGQLGWSAREIEEKTGIYRETVSKYLRRGGLAVRAPGRWGHPPKAAMEVSTDSTAKAAIEVSTDPVRPTRSPSASKCEPFRDVISQALDARRNSVTIYQDLVDRHGFDGSPKSVARFVQALLKERGEDQAAPCGIIETQPGEEAQVDYGEGPMVRDPQSGKYKRTRLFVMTLGFSRKCVRLLSWRSSSRIWAELHEAAFRRLGGVPRVVVLDNLKEGVLEPEVYDPVVNPLYAGVLRHYGVVALPCRVRDPDRKGKVERAIGHTQGALKGLRFELLEDAQAHLDHWDARWADTRIHGTTKRQVAALFDEEKQALKPLPLEPFRYYEFGERTVHPDGCVEVALAYYEAPPGLLGQTVLVQWDDRRVRLLDKPTGQLLVEYERRPPGRSSRAYAGPTHSQKVMTLWLTRARKAGGNIGSLCCAIEQHEGADGLRRIQGVVRFCRRYGATSVDDACRLALEAGAPTYRFVRSILRQQPQQQLLAQINPLIRELTHYRDVIARKTQETTR